MSTQAVTAAKAWVREFVIGLNLCPFAKSPMDEERIRFAASKAVDPYEALADVLVEIDTLDNPNGPATTLIVFDRLFADFETFMDWCAAAVDLLAAEGRQTVYQFAHFHPDYVFDGAPADDPANKTNRSPHPMLHILRCADVTWAIETHPDTTSIPDRNIALLRKMFEC